MSECSTTDYVACFRDDYEEALKEKNATISTQAEQIAALTQRVAEESARADKNMETIQEMVRIAAENRLDGYRELGQRAATAESERDAAMAEAGRLWEALEIQGKWVSSCGNNGDLPSFDELDEFRRDMDKVDTLTKATAPPAASDDDGLSHGVCPQCLNDGRNGEPLGRVTFEQDGATIEYRTCDECGWNGPEIVRPKPHAAGD